MGILEAFPAKGFCIMPIIMATMDAALITALTPAYPMKTQISSPVKFG